MEANGLEANGGVGKRVAAILAVSIAGYAGIPPIQEGSRAVRCAESTSRAAEHVGPHQERLAGFLKERQSAIRLAEFNLISSEIKRGPGLTLSIYLNASGDIRLDNREGRDRYAGFHGEDIGPPLSVGPEFTRAFLSLRPSAEPVGRDFCGIVVPIVADGDLQGLMGFVGTPQPNRGGAYSGSDQ